MISEVLINLIFFFLFWPNPWPVEVPGSGIKPKLQQQPKPLQWQCCILYHLSHKRTSCLLCVDAPHWLVVPFDCCEPCCCGHLGTVLCVDVYLWFSECWVLLFLFLGGSHIDTVPSLKRKWWHPGTWTVFLGDLACPARPGRCFFKPVWLC